MRQEQLVRRPAQRDASRRRPPVELVVRDLRDTSAATETDQVLERIERALGDTTSST